MQDVASQGRTPPDLGDPAFRRNAGGPVHIAILDQIVDQLSDHPAIRHTFGRLGQERDQLDARCADLGAVLHLDEEGALEAAEASDTRRAADGSLGPLDGVPVAGCELTWREC